MERQKRSVLNKEEYQVEGGLTIKEVYCLTISGLPLPEIRWLKALSENKYFSRDYKQTLPLKQRFTILKRDNFKCRYCGRSASDGTVLQIDHITPKSKGGLNTNDNLITSCKECNLGKGDVLLGQY